MTIDQAIETQTDMLHARAKELEKLEVDAIKLGIEALNRIKAGRNPEHLYSSNLLPSETED